MKAMKGAKMHDFENPKKTIVKANEKEPTVRAMKAMQVTKTMEARKAKQRSTPACRISMMESQWGVWERKGVMLKERLQIVE